MPMMLLKLVTLLLSGLLAGAVVLVWVGDRPFDMSPRLYVEFQQARISALTLPMPLLGASTTIFAILLTLSLRGQQSAFYLTLAATLCFVAGMAVTVAFNMPINNQVVVWSAGAPPADWWQLRDRWWSWHIVRTLLSIAAFISLLLSILLPAGSESL